ncbi:MAG: hypothetical protein WA624_15625 [Methylocella sp.]
MSDALNCGDQSEFLIRDDQAAMADSVEPDIDLNRQMGEMADAKGSYNSSQGTIPHIARNNN